jgi:integrase
MKGARDRTAKAPYPIAELVADYLASAEYAGKAEGTRNLYATTARKVTRLLGDYPVNDLRRDDLQLVLDNEFAGAGSHNIFVSVLGILYTFARRRDKTTLEPTKDIQPLKGGEHSAWPHSALQAGLEAAHDRTRLVVHLLYYTGQRIGDVMKMRWSDIRDGRVSVVQQKTGKSLRIRLHRDLAAELERTPRKGLHIVTNQDGARMTPQVVRRELKALGDSLGLQLVPHGLRKNAVIALLEAGCSVAETAAITGQTYSMVEHYAKQINQARMASAAIIKWQGVKP